MPMPPIHEMPEALQVLLSAAPDAQRPQGLQALQLLQTRQPDPYPPLQAPR
jgi:hypothetical protein